MWLHLFISSCISSLQLIPLYRASDIEWLMSVNEEVSEIYIRVTRITYSVCKFNVFKHIWYPE